jgi:hypothetical protein
MSALSSVGGCTRSFPRRGFRLPRCLTVRIRFLLGAELTDLLVHLGQLVPEALRSLGYLALVPEVRSQEGIGEKAGQGANQCNPHG